MFHPDRRCAPHPPGRRCALCGQPSYARGAPEGRRGDAALCEECVLGLRREDAGASPAFQRIGDGSERVIRLLRGEE